MKHEGQDEAAPTSGPAKRPRAQKPGARAHEHLLLAADELFYREGVRAVGIEAVVERAGVNKMSLYRQFSSKDDLVVAYLQRCDVRFFQRFDESLAKHPGEPVKQLVQYFEDLARRASAPDYRGCPFVNVATEFPDATHPARRSVDDNKSKLIARLTALAQEAGATDAVALAEELALIVEGVYAASQTYGPGCGVIHAAPRMAKRLIEAACPAPLK
ncbi:TetR/AcrR family transcriptional regulator [Paraburkholderia unamae]|uniref:TetR family transcriptional regulator n=1 Tax=Paraburkholderia unamae TaxID=219649 RepID=A0ABX5KGK3_9BURK|nr:TetR/AcrR family transcriptional regulator [Paraburkholderia unamae]PVX74147.1 TetR family transcriptional regulator [Paraburkholderia unamae]CAG9272051.1 Transcriptional regulator, TetR family [Paraburkholderia unamae]